MTREEFEKNENQEGTRRLAAALSDPAGWQKPSAGFAVRGLAFVRRSLSGAAQDRVPSRWPKVAAGLAIMAGAACFASWMAVTILGDGADVPVDAETETITRILREGENTMIARKTAGLVGAAMLSVSVPAASLESESTFVFLRPETSSFWNTATNNVMTVPIDYPAGAKSATLGVSGLDYAASYPDITARSYTFTLPEPTSAETENVYDLTLTFDDGTVRTAKLGLIQGLSPDSEGVTRCLAPATGRVWSKVRGKAVLPIPYGTTSFKINDQETETGLKGAQGWYPIKISGSDQVTLSLIANEIQYTANLIGGLGGLMLLVK